MTLRPIPSPLDPRAAELTIVEAAGLAQARAAWPGWSAWVSANAGSGKTRVLTSRVARLLLRGAKPAKILCLTYTKAAAAEMTNRLTETLGRWALLDDDALSRELAELEAGLDPSERAGVDLGQARRLFAEALETPGGLKIQTIHAFCDAVLRRFPLEAGVSPDFTVIDDAARRALALEARDALAEDAASGRDDAFDAVAAILTDEGLDALIDAILARRALFADPPGEAALRAAFGVGQADLDIPPLETFRRALDADALAYAGGLLCEGSVTERPRGVALKAAAAAPDAGAVAEALDAALLTRKGAPLKSQVTKATAARADWLRPFLEDLAAAFLDAQESDRAVAGFRRAQALNRFAARLLARYAAARRARGALDYDDLIEGVAGLFSRSEMAAWALFKLDGGIDHVLVDEAQDTAPAQWAVIEALTAEFFAGAGRAREPGALDRTVFVVGDEKQSIYSFQGAEPGVFGAKRTGFRERAVAADKPFEDKVTLATSFRSAPAILTVVDRVCAVAPEGLASPEEDIAHYAARADRPGRVDLWPLLPKPETAEEPPWDRPVDAPPPGDPKIELARLIAAEIRRWLDEGEALPGDGRPIRPGDVMILVRRRDRLAAELVRSLKRLGVAVAGADRLKLTEDLAVRDLLALARFALTPGDDLTLAALLRSPLCGLSEKQLFEAAHDRTGSLWNALREKRARWPETAAFLERARKGADFLRPHEFLDRVLTVESGRRRLLARLGTEAEDPIDELLAQALAYESTEPPTLEGFLAWIGRGGVEIKREMDKGSEAEGGEVRVMTVHGAKGLEAPVVILPDTVARLGGRLPPILPMPCGNRTVAAWTTAKAEAPEALRRAAEAAEARALEESRRLLYVAMTRAERWLIVCGAGEAKGETWHGLVEAGMRATTTAVEVDGPASPPGPILRVADGFPAARERPADAAAAPETTPPLWARRPAPPPPERRPIRAASALAGDAAEAALDLATPFEADTVAPASALVSTRDADAARRRGLAIHALLEILPEAPAADRSSRADALIRAHMPEAAPEARAAMLAEAERAMAAPGAGAVFGPDALAEAAFAADIPGLGRVDGRIDRLAVKAGRVLAVDFKSDAAPPETPEAVPEAYLRQMAAYRAALTALHPDSAVEVALLWTAAARLMPLPPALLDAALARAIADTA